MKEQYSLEDTAEIISLRSSWQQVLKRLSAEIRTAWFERFIRPLEPISFSDDVVVIGAPGSFVQEWVRERYLGYLTELLSDELGSHVRIELKAEPRAKNAPREALASVALSAQNEPARFTPSQRFSFDNFVVGQSNRLAFAGAKAVASEPGTKFNPLFIYGQSGLGKTHLLHAIAREILNRDPKAALAYLSAQQFAEDFVTALQNNRIEQFRRAQRNVEVWLLDDVQFIAGKDKTQEEIFHTFNYLHALGKQIVLCSDRPPRDLFLMDERLRSRFEAGLVADIQMPDTETRCAILLSKAAQDRLELPLEVAMFLAENVPGNIRILEGALTKLVVQSSIEGLELNLDVASLLVDQYYRAGSLAKPSVTQIVNAVSQQFQIAGAEITGTSRKAPIVHARHIAVYITREITGDSWKHIGTAFGGRDHTSMMHGYQKVSEMMREDKDLKATVKMLVRNLYPDA